jgi:hypothetical protein
MLMKTILGLSVILALLFTSCSNGKDANSENSDSTKNAQLSQSQTLTVSGFDSLAKDYVDKEILVKGLVDHVCKHGGKKLFLVDGDASLHVESDNRFSDSLIGSEVLVSGIVREFRVDEAYCLKMEEDNIKSHAKGQTEKELYEQKKEMIAEYRDSMKAAKTDHLSFYSLEFVSLK